MIEVRGLTKFYGDKAAVRDLTFSIERGEVVGFLGPNGAGKTTTMRILTGYLAASEGTASVAGEDIFDRSLQARRHIGYLPETVPLYTDLSVRAYLDFMAKIRGVARAGRRARVELVAESTGLVEYLDRPISQLSRGFRQRVGLAQAIVHDPDVIILDEPTVGLDPIQVRDVRALIRNLGQEKTVVLSSHILSEVSQLCTRVLVINDGVLRADDTPEGLDRALNAGGGVKITMEVAAPESELLAGLGAVDGVREIRTTGSHEGHIVVEIEAGDAELRSRLAAAVVRAGWDLFGLRLESLSLEDIFVRLMGTSETEPDDGEEAETGLTDAEMEAAARFEEAEAAPSREEPTVPPLEYPGPSTHHPADPNPEEPTDA